MAYFDDIPAQDLSIFNQRTAEAEEPKTGALRKLGDIGIAGARGAVTGVKLLSDATGAGNPVSESLEGASKWLTGLESPGRAAEKQARAQKIAEAEKSGSTWAEIAANLGGFFEAPVSSTVEALGTSAPTLLTAAIPGVGPAALAARGAATIGMGALQGAGSVKGQIYDTVKAEQLKAGKPPAEAEARALAAQEYTGANAANIAAGSALGAAAGRFGLEGMLEKSLGGRGLAGGVVRRTGTGVVTEGIPEAAQGGQERYASNVALQREGFDTPTFQGVAGNAAAEGIAGGAPGGVGGALARPREEPPGIVPPAGLDAPPPIAPSGPLTRAAETAVGAQAGQNAAAAAAGVDPAMRLAELEQKATGTKDQKVPGPDGKPVTVPGTPAQFLTDAEKQERDSLKGSVSEAEVAARNPIAPTSPAAMAAAGPPADPLPAMHQAAADNLAAQKQFGGDRPGIPSTNAVVYQEPKPRDMPPAFEQPVTPGQIFESIEEIRARQQQDGEMLSGLVRIKNEVVPFRGNPPAIDEKTIDGDGLYRVIGEATAAAPDFADHTDLAGRAFAKNPRLTLEVLRDPRIDHEQETVVLRAITRGGNATAQYAKLALEAFQAKPEAAGAQPQTGGSTGVVPQGQEVGAAQPEPLARQEGAPSSTQGTKNGFIATPDGRRVRIAQHERGSNVLDPQGDAGAFTYEVSANGGDTNPLLMVLGKDGRLTPAKNAIGPDNKSNGTAWVPPNQEAADRVRALLEARSQMPVGSPERKANDADIKRAVLGEPAKVESDSTPPLTIEPVSDEVMVIRGSGKHKEAIKAAGGRWNTPQNGWTFPKAQEAKVRAALGDLVGGKPAEAAKIDGAETLQNRRDPPAPRNATGPLRVTESADSGQYSVRDEQGSSMGTFVIKDGKATSIKARAQWAMDDVKAAAQDHAERLAKSAPTETKRGAVGMKMAAGDVVLTATGRQTSPFPKVDTSTDRKASNTLKWVDAWLMTNAAEEARARGDDFNLRQFEQAGTKPTQADKDSAEEYLFGDTIPKVIPSILKPLTATKAEPTKQDGVAKRDSIAPAKTDDLDAMFNDVLAEELAKDEAKADGDANTRKVGDLKAPRGAGEALGSAAKNTAAGLGAAIDGLGKLFGGKGRLGSGPTFDEETYAQAKPYFLEAIKHLKDAGSDIREAMRAIVRMVLDKFGADTARAMQPYAVRFIADVQSGSIDKQTGDGNERNDPAADPGAGGADPRAGADRQQGAGTENPDGVAPGKPEDVGAPGAGSGQGSGTDRAGGDVGGVRPVQGRRNAPNGRTRAGRARVADDGAGDRVAPESQRANYHIADPEALIGGSPKVRFDRNKRAIEAYQSITAEGRQPTQEELDVMAAYIGWGSFGQELFQGSFDYPAPKAGWQKESDWLREQLGEDGWKSAQSSIINAHYTDPITVATMWDMVRQMGFTGGRVLEPSMGVGNFFGLMPRDLMARSQLAGIEMEQTTGGMAKLLYPEANIQIQPYQDSRTADGFYDLVIGNWPFAKDGPADRRYMNLSPSLHDFFFLKALDQTRPGGLVVGITSAGTMDKQGTLTRAALAEKADLVAAFRLPSGAFEKYAGTSVVTDIIILKRRDTPGDARASGWLQTAEVDTPNGQKIKVNQYFQTSPEKVLGTLNFGHGSTYGRPSMIVERPADLEQRLRALPETLPKVYEPRTTKGKTIRYVTNNTKDRQQSVIVKDGKLYQVHGDYLAPLVDVTDYRLKDAKKTADREDQLRRLIEMRRAYGTLIDAERDGAADVEAKRTALREAFEAFAKEHGRITQSDGLKILDRVGDPFYPTLAALERPDGTPAAILTKATTRARRKLDNPSVRDALVLARNEAMDLSVDRVAEIAKVTTEAAAKELMEAGAIFRTPVGTYEPSDVYLSGNVRRKLREAQAAADAGQDMARNIQALTEVMPKDVPYFNIEAKLGATWIRPEQYREFIASMLGVEPSEKMKVRWAFNRWRVHFEDRALNARPEATTTWGSNSVRFDKLVTAAMGNVALKVTYRDQDGVQRVDEEATAEANEKANKVREHFSEWLWSEPARRIEMEQTFNEVMNAIALPKFDGSFLNFDGMALQRGDSPFNLRKHQIDAIWRGLANGRSINAHEVGTGKTYTMGGLVVESRRYGLAKKPLIFAHNANSASVAREIGEMYPGAKLLYIDNLAPDKIATTMRQIANDDWDAIVVPHSLISRFSLKRETLEALQRDQIQALEQEAIEAAQEDNASLKVEDMDDEKAMAKVRSVTAKQLVHARNAIIKKIDEMALRSSREDAVSFEDMGVDMIVVDEAHEFKKPPLVTRMRMKGLNTQASAQSISMQFLTDYVKKVNGGRGVHTFTGTPITNTLNEIYNQMRFVMDDQMDRDGVKDWDGWFNTFADSTSDVELTAAGEYEPVTRLASFVNVAELRRMVGQYMDIVFADDMPEFKPRSTADGKILSDANLTDADRSHLTNGRNENPIGRPYKRIVTDVADMSPAQATILATLQRHANTFKLATGKERKEIIMSGGPESPVIVETGASNAGLDARLYDQNAPDDPKSKVNRAVGRILDHYQEHEKATQVVFMERGFSDESVSRKKDRLTGKVTVTKKSRFNLVRDMVDKLVEGGIPEHQIAIVDGSTSKDKRKAIADAMNRAEIRVVIGNSKTLGVGVNMQENLRAMHHLDAPWTPGDLEQRNGRGHRQGNKWNTVLEYRYLTERLDGRRWQVLAVKDRFIKAFLRADDTVRVIDGDAVSMDEADDIGATLSEAAGDPRLLIVNKLKADVGKLENKERMHAQAVFSAKDRITDLKDSIKRLSEDVAIGEKDFEDFKAKVKGDLVVKVGDKTYTDIESANTAMAAEAKGVEVGSNGKLLAEVWGFKIFGEKPFAWADPRFRIAGVGTHSMGKGSIESARQTLYGLADRVKSMNERIAEAKDSIPRMQEASKAPFAREQDLAKKRKMLADVEADIVANPVPAPSWLRNGAPTNTEVYVGGKPAVVDGHRWTDDGYFVTVTQGEAARDVPYEDVKDANGLPVYEPREFAKPKVSAATTTPKVAPKAKFSRGDGTGMQPDAVRATVERLAKGWKNAPEVVVLASMDEAPAEVQENDAQQRSGGAEGDPEGFFHNGKVYILASALDTEADVERILAHEALGHYGLRGAFGIKALGDIVEQIVRARPGDVAAKARAYGLGTSPAMRMVAAEEILAEMAQTQPTLGFVRRAIAAIRTWLRQRGVGLRMSDDEVVRNYILPARRFVQGQRTGESAAGSPVPAFSREDDVFVNEVLAELSQHDDLFRYSESKKTTLDGVMAEVFSQAKYLGDDTRPDEREESGADVRHVFQTALGKNFYIYERGKEVWADISRLEEGEHGGGIYAAILNYTHNAKKVLIGDPAGLSEAAVIRRTSAMLSSALRFGTTAHMDAAAEQRAGDPAKGIAPLKWQGDDVQKTSALIETFLSTLYTQMPALKGYRYDFRTRKFLDRSGRPLGPDRFADASRLGISRSARVGEATARRGIFLQSLVSSEGSARPGLLEQVLRRGNSLAGGDLRGMFSRKKTVEQARETFADMMQSTKAFNWWNKSIGTQYQKAQQNTTFRAVYNRVQDYIQDISDFGSRAAGQAPTLLPRLDKIRDVLKKPVSAADQKAIAAALYGGTLAGESVTDGRLWSDDELRTQFKLTDPQIALYREARAAIDQSIDDLGRTEIAKLVGDTVDPMFAQQAREAGSMADASETLQAGLDEKIDEARQVDSEEAQRKVAHLRSLRRAVRAQTKRVAELKDAGYMPLMRFGKYAVNVPDPDVEGESLHFALFDSERLANAHARELRNDPQFAGKQITQGIISDRAAQLMQGVDPATLEIFAEAIGASESEVFQEYLKLVTSQRSAMKRLIERKGTPGYSEDVKRTLASFITSNARAASGNLHLRDLLLNTSKIKEGDVKDEAIGLVKHILDPQPDPSAKARSLLFMQFIGGSVASALVNLTQPVTMTLPYLSQYSSPGHAANLLRKATMAAVRGVTGAEAEALHRAERDGIVSPQEIHFLYGEAEKAFGSNPLLQRAGFLWGAPFGLAEQFNRRATFIAAYRLGVERKEANPFAFAEKAVIETQGVYNRGNASNWARNPVGGALLTFKQFSVAYLELLKRLPNRERAIALAILALASGMEGLPGADDLDDILDTFAQAFGYNWSSKQAKRDFITSTLGPEMAQFATRGVSAFLPLDVSARMGMGNLLPGTGLLMQSRQDKGREVAEVFGAPGGAVQMVGKAATQAMAGEPVAAVSAVLPVALQNLLDPNRGALALAASGQYKDERGRRVVDVDAVDALLKAAGFNPTAVSEPQMAMRIAKQSIDLARAVESDIAGDLAAARVESDSARADAARARLADWNEKNPDTPIRIEESQIRRRAREMQTTKADRLTRTAPRELREGIRRRVETVDE